jgi:hypothetical protein
MIMTAQKNLEHFRNFISRLLSPLANRKLYVYDLLKSCRLYDPLKNKKSYVYDLTDSLVMWSTKNRKWLIYDLTESSTLGYVIHQKQEVTCLWPHRKLQVTWSTEKKEVMSL